MNGENLSEQLAVAIAERNRLREAIIEASLIVGAEDMDERKWALLIGRLNDALNGREPAAWQIWRERAMNAEAERNQLRAVVDALREYLAGTAPISRVHRELAALDEKTP